MSNISTDNSEIVLPEYPDDHLVKPAIVSKSLNVSTGTLAVWRCTDRYDLNFYKVGNSVLYRVGDVRNFLRGRMH